MPRKFRLGRHIKNRERKKHTARHAEKLLCTPLIVSVPLSSLPSLSVDILGRRLAEIGDFRSGWIIKTAEEKVVVSLLDTSRSVPDIKYSLAIEANFSWKIHIYGQEVSPSMCRLFTDSPATLHTVHAVSAIVQSLEKSHMCRNFTIFSLKKI
ncbi:hypothetical protein GBAR_LOCUS25789, partial [Geodia barretti]